MKNWCEFLTAREKLVPIRHIFRTNISHSVKNAHEVKFNIANMSFPHIDKISLKFAALCIRFQFFTVLSLTSVTIKYQFFTSVIIWYQFFTSVRIWYQLSTSVNFDTNFSHMMIRYQFFTDVRDGYRFLKRVMIWYPFFTFVKIWYQFFTSE